MMAIALLCVAMNEMSWLCLRPTAIALFHRFTMLWLRRICNTPSSVKAVLSTNFQGALNLQRSLFLAGLLMEYLTQVGLCVWIWVAPAQKFASSSNAAENCWRFCTIDDMSEATDLSAWTAQNASWSRSYAIRNIERAPFA